jgi:hypothetical protein
MAAVKDRVRCRVNDGGASLSTVVLQPQPPRFGVVTARDDGASTQDVLFENGRMVEDIPDTALEEVRNVVDGAGEPDEETISAFLYQVVRASGLGASQEYTGIVVDLYVVFPETLALVKTLNGDLYYESTLAQLVRVDAEGVPQ